MKMLPKLTPDDVVGKMTWTEVMQYYFPDMSDEEADMILWEDTAFPFDNVEGQLDSIYELYTACKNEEITSK